MVPAWLEPWSLCLRIPSAFLTTRINEGLVLLGLMQEFPLIIPRLLTYAEKFHRHTEIVSRRLEGDIHRYTFADLGRRSRQLANALKQLGV